MGMSPLSMELKNSDMAFTFAAEGVTLDPDALKGKHLEGVDLSGQDFAGQDLRGAMLKRATFRQAHEWQRIHLDSGWLHRERADVIPATRPVVVAIQAQPAFIVNRGVAGNDQLIPSRRQQATFNHQYHGIRSN